MNKRMAIFLVTLIMFWSLTPCFALADGLDRDLPTRPYEKLVSINGPWYKELMKTNDSADLFVGYEGSYAIDADVLANQTSMSFKVKEDMVLSGIYIPFTNNVSTEISVELIDETGNIYGPYALIPYQSLSIKELSTGSDNSYDDVNGKWTYSFIPGNTIELVEGLYTMKLSDASWQVRSNQTGPEGAYLIKGMHAKSYFDYQEASANLNNTGVSEGSKDEKPFEENPYGAEKPLEFQAAIFTLEEDAFVAEIILNTINGGHGAIPGTIAIYDEKGEAVYADQSYGATLVDVPNAMWIIAPEVVFPAGTYQIGMSSPEVMSYNISGKPQFIVKVTETPVYRLDFSGMYSIDLDTYKRSTIMGPVNDENSSFSLNRFELTIIDHVDWIELIGRYKNMPFSQRADVIELTDTGLVAKFKFSADLSGLPVKTKIGANATLYLEEDDKDGVTLTVGGTATYKRAASSDKGEDDNTYELLVNGDRKVESLPPYVIAAIGTSASAGGVPGPDNATEASTGLLFPPLVALVVHVVQEALKKAAEAARIARGPKKYTKEWYKSQNPDASDETLAMIMMADAMAHTDNPDDDPESISDEVISESSETSRDFESLEDDSEVENNSDEALSEYEEIPDHESEVLTEEEFMSEEEKMDRAQQEHEVSEEVEPIPEIEPETMTLETGIDGKTSTYEKDSETGEWINPLTGGVLDREAYEKVVKPNLAKEQDWIDKERSKIANHDTEQDRQLAKMLKEEKEHAYENKLMKKYKVDNRKDLEAKIGKMMKTEKERADKWNMIGDIAAVGEVGSTVIGVAADTFIDFAGDYTGPVGKGIKAGYKVIKTVAGDVADKGADANIIIGALIKGGSDAGGDFIPGKFGKTKAFITIASEAVAGAVQAKVGEGDQGMAEGFTSGVIKAASGYVTDKIGGEGMGRAMGIESAGKNMFKVTISRGGGKSVTKLVSGSTATKHIFKKIDAQIKQSGTKFVSGLVDNFVTKPAVTGPVGNYAKSLVNK